MKLLHIVANVDQCVISYVTTIVQFQLQFAFKVTVRHVNKIVLRIDLKINGVNTRRERVDGYIAEFHETVIRRWDIEQIQT